MLKASLIAFVMVATIAPANAQIPPPRNPVPPIILDPPGRSSSWGDYNVVVRNLSGTYLTLFSSALGRPQWVRQGEAPPGGSVEWTKRSEFCRQLLRAEFANGVVQEEEVDTCVTRIIALNNK